MQYTFTLIFTKTILMLINFIKNEIMLTSLYYENKSFSFQNNQITKNKFQLC